MHLHIWTIYDHPSDYPDAYVARLWVVLPDGPLALDRPVLASDSLSYLRSILPPGLTRLPREPSDDPKIVESWV